MTVRIRLKEKVNLEILEKLKYSKKLLEESTTDKNLIQLLNIYSKEIKNGMVQVDYILEGYGRLKNIINGKIGFSYTNMKKEIRSLLAINYYKYLDIKNCQPVIIYNLCKRYNIKCVQLLDYINNRDKYFEEYILSKDISKKELKSLFISLFYGKKNLNEIRNLIFNGGKVDDWIIKLHNELIIIREMILKNDKYKDIIEFSNKSRKAKNKNYNLDGAAFCLIIQDYERQIVSEFEYEIIKSGYTLGARIHDGIFVDKNKEISDSVLNNWINIVSVKLNMNILGSLKYILRNEELEIDNSYLEQCVFDYYDKPLFEYNTISMEKLDYNKITEYFINSKHRVLKSGYSTGKTTYIKKLINNMNNDDYRIAFLTMRQSLARSIYKDFIKLKFKNYLNKKDEISCYDNRIIISLDSLYKLNNKKLIPYNTVICDEFCSLLSHMSFEGMKNQHDTYNIFEDLINQANVVYYLDGDISNREVLFLRKYFNYIDKPLVNTCANIKYDFVLTYNYEWYMEQINNDIQNNSNIVISSMSSNFTENIGELFKDRKTLIINSETDDKIKEKLYDVEELFTDYNIVAYSPTVGAGVDYNVPHFNKLYGYMCNKSVCARDFFQMLFRIRQVEIKQIIIYVSRNIKKYTLPLIKTFDEIKTALYRNYEIPPLTYIELWNKWEKDNNEIYLLDIFIYYAKLKNHTINIMDDNNDKDNNDNIDNDIDDINNYEIEKDNKKSINIIMNNVYNSQLIEKDTYDKLIQKVKINEATKTDKYQIEKYIHYSRWLLEPDINLNNFKKYYHKLNVLKSYWIYDNIDKFNKVLKLFKINNNEDSIYNNFTKRLIYPEVISNEYNIEIINLKEGEDNIAKKQIIIDKMNKEIQLVNDKLIKIKEILNVHEADIYNKLHNLFWKMGYNMRYIKINQNDKNDNKNKFLLQIYNTIFKKEFTKNIISQRLEYLNKIIDIIQLKEINTSKNKEEIESKIPFINIILKENCFRTLFEIRNNNIKTIKSLLGTLNKVFGYFGMIIETIKIGNSKNRIYEYRLSRIDIIEEYLKKIDNKEIIEIDM